MLRMDKNISSELKINRVNEVLREFNLTNRSNVAIGIPGRLKGISGGEKRRLAFASEILTDPALLFCDEPTSGLDSFMAKSIVKYLQKLARSGKTIICTIHQPSSETFSYFDSICLLSQSRMGFFGSREAALEYFSVSLHKDCPALTNPCDFFIDTFGIDVTDTESSRNQLLVTLFV
jgi:ATP-binding cassette, subfamily G (WHITE), eye pigment precursor transporter